MKKKFIALVVMVGLTGVSVWISSCSKSNSSGSASAKLQFNNATPTNTGFLNILERFMIENAAAAITRSEATTFKMKLIAAYLTEDIDPVTQNNRGQTSMFYLNPSCEDDIMHCDISGGTAEDGQPMSKVVNNYFDFGLPTDDVNAALNAQNRSIYATSYKYVRLEFCKYNSQSSPNIIWGGGNANPVSDKTFQRNSCTVNSAEMNPPIEVKDGDTITVRVAYDLSQSISEGSDHSGSNQRIIDDCVGDGDARTCFTLPDFVPSASH